MDTRNNTARVSLRHTGCANRTGHRYVAVHLSSLIVESVRRYRPGSFHSGCRQRQEAGERFRARGQRGTSAPLLSIQPVEPRPVPLGFLVRGYRRHVEVRMGYRALPDTPGQTGDSEAP